MLIYAGKRVRNRSQIPLRAYRACAFALFRILLRDGYFIPQKFDYGLRPSLRMTRGGCVYFDILLTKYSLWSIMLNREICSLKGDFDMKKVFKMEDLDCAHCAAKMEEGIKKIEGVTYASVSFMAQRLTVEADEDKFEEIIPQIVKAVKKVDSDCKVIIK